MITGPEFGERAIMALVVSWVEKQHPENFLPFFVGMTYKEYIPFFPRYDLE